MIGIDVLARLALGDLDEDEERAAEEHVLACSECARTLEGLVTAGESVRALLDAGDARAFVTPSLVAELDRAGLVTRRYVLAPGTSVPCTVDTKDVYVLTTIEADLRDVARVDVELPGGPRAVDVPFDAARGTISFVTSAEPLRALPSTKLPVRAIAVDRDGRERALGEYVLDHTAFAG